MVQLATQLGYCGKASTGNTPQPVPPILVADTPVEHQPALVDQPPEQEATPTIPGDDESAIDTLCPSRYPLPECALLPSQNFSSAFRKRPELNCPDPLYPSDISLNDSTDNPSILGFPRILGSPRKESPTSMPPTMIEDDVRRIIV